MRSYGVVVPSPVFDHDLGFVERVEGLTVEQFVTQFPLPLHQSFGPHHQPHGPVTSEHQPAEASKQSLQPYASSFPSPNPPLSKTYIREDHFKGGRSPPRYELLCRVCGAQLQSRHGRFLLKYSLMRRAQKPRVLNTKVAHSTRGIDSSPKLVIDIATGMVEFRPMTSREQRKELAAVASERKDLAKIEKRSRLARPTRKRS
jgi:hypothetical protein